MKKRMFFLLTAAIVTAGCMTVFGNTIPRVYLNDNKLLLQNSPYIENDTTYVPLRAVADNMGLSLDWNDTTQTITLKSDKATILQQIGKSTANVNNKEVSLPAPAQIKGGVTYVPIRFVSEALGAEISYNADENTVKIDYCLPKGENYKYDPFGRLIRTTDLPANADLFPYISAGAPNALYEDLLLSYQSGKWLITPVEGKHYARPVLTKEDPWGTDENIQIWRENAEKNLNLRLNFDYRTVDDEWMQALMYTYPSRYGQNYYVDRYTKKLTEYIAYAKKNHLVIEGDYYLEPSVTYQHDGFNMRAWVKYRIKSDMTDGAMVFQTNMFNDVETNVWYAGYMDISFGTNQANNGGSNLVIGSDAIERGNSTTIKKID